MSELEQERTYIERKLIPAKRSFLANSVANNLEKIGREWRTNGHEQDMFPRPRRCEKIFGQRVWVLPRHAAEAFNVFALYRQI
ncbi:MAG TPA: hypothetical protein VG734_07495, partial [Lacunisphaera sp.]|nr:hypothetical protein [Lacunisphaera sp.]